MIPLFFQAMYWATAIVGTRRPYVGVSYLLALVALLLSEVIEYALMLERWPSRDIVI
jgi:hypothetical protein